MNELRVPGLDDAEAATVGSLNEQLQRKSRRNHLRASYYDGRRAVHQVGTVIPPQYYKLGLVLGWSAKAVDVLARRCNLDGFTWPDGTLSDIGGDDVIRQNDLLTEIASARISSLIHGVSWLVTTVGQSGEPDAMIHIKDAVNATGEWDARRRELSAFFSVTDVDPIGNIIGFSLYLPDRVTTAFKDAGKWEVHRESRDGIGVEPMVYKPRIGRPFGSSRISRPVMSLHDQALRTMIRMEGHADVYSFPEMWMLGADPSIFKNADGSAKASWQVMLGRIKGIPDDDDAENPRAEVKQFSASDPKPHLDQMRQQAQMFAGETSIPIDSLGFADRANPTSAESYIAAREDLIAEAEGATDDWTRPVQRSLMHALRIVNRERNIPDAWRTIMPDWRSPIYLSRAAQADAGMKQLSAVPWLAETRTGLELLGLTPNEVDMAMAEKRRMQGSAALQALQRASERGD